MSDYNAPPDIAAAFADIRTRLEALERKKNPPQYTTGNRPAAADVEGLLIYNLTTKKHQGSNGTTWNDCY